MGGGCPDAPTILAGAPDPGVNYTNPMGCPQSWFDAVLGRRSSPPRPASCGRLLCYGAEFFVKAQFSTSPPFRATEYCCLAGLTLGLATPPPPEPPAH